MARLHANWSWTADEAQNKSSEEPGRTLYEEANKVRAAFAAQNPGYALGISPIRSLESQVALWNRNATVHAAGLQLLTRVSAELATATYPTAPTSAAVAVFASTLRSAHVTPEPSNAAPGTSDHGRGIAVDFVVLRGASTVAGANIADISSKWKSLGFESKLIEACKGTGLRGPLKMPYEPWHWVLPR